MIGFIGTGTIGAPMAAQLQKGAGPIRVFDRNPAATSDLTAAGATRAASAAEIAASCSTVFLSLPGPPQIETVVLGTDGLLASSGAVNAIVDLSTNSLALNRRIAASAAAAGIDYLDAPVSGGRIAAEKGELAIMVGGDEAAFRRAEPLLKHLGSNIFYLGASGNGTLAKLVNNQIFLAASVLIQEGFVLGAKAGMDANALLEVIRASSAGPLLARAPLVLSRKFDLDVFALSIAAKDVTVALDSARDLGVDMPATEAAAGVYAAAVAAGLGHEDFFATVKVLEQQAGVTVAGLKPRRSD